MEKDEKTPLWVFLAFSSINTRRGALILIGVSVLFTLYCVPWTLFVTEPAWLKQVFLIEDWSWLAMMVPVLIWYAVCLAWCDRNSVWKEN